MKRILLFSLLALVAASCRPDSVVPMAGGDEPPPYDGGGIVSIAFLKSLYTGTATRITGEYIIEGTVVSNDRQGNFYRTLVLWDGTGGIEIRLGMEQIFKAFGLHSRVTVRCNGLWLGSYGGTLQLGGAPFDGYETQALDEAAIAGHVQRTSEFYEVVEPQRLAIGELRPENVSTFVVFEGVRFVDSEQGLSWADTGDEAPAATNRHVVDGDGNVLTVRTSSHATFAARMLPSGTGYIEGILGVFNGEYQLTMREERGAVMRDQGAFGN